MHVNNVSQKITCIFVLASNETTSYDGQTTDIKADVSIAFNASANDKAVRMANFSLSALIILTWCIKHIRLDVILV